MSQRSNRKPAPGQSRIKTKHVAPMSCKLEPAIWSRDTGQRIPCFVSTDHNVDVQYQRSLCQPIVWSMAAMLRDSVDVAVVVWTRPRAILLVMITMRKSTHGFPFLSRMSMGLRLAVLRAPGAPLLLNKIKKASRYLAQCGWTQLCGWHWKRLWFAWALKAPIVTSTTALETDKSNGKSTWSPYFLL